MILYSDGTSEQDLISQLQAAAEPFFETARLVVATSGSDFTLRLFGQLKGDSATVHTRLQDAFSALQQDAFLRVADDGTHILEARPKLQRSANNRQWLSLALFVLTFVSVLWTGANAQLAFDNPENANAAGWQQLLLGLPYALTIMGILLAHEFGHYFAGRYHHESTSLPLFIPAPFSPFGTMGAVIFGGGHIKNRRVLLDIGIAGPWAGLLVTIPVLLYGLSLSRLSPLTDLSNVSLEGNSLLYLLAKFAVFGKLLPAPAAMPTHPLLYWLGYWLTGLPEPVGALDVSLHPIAWAGWAGLLVTGLNLLPVGQLDGGHTIFSLLGKRSRYAFPAVLVMLGLLSIRWQGWLLWVALIWLGRTPASVRDEITELDPKRRALAIATLVLFVLVFTPVPLLLF